jgi:RNA 2',3'-cyclic 3'-phosphodiesterase
VTNPRDIRSTAGTGGNASPTAGPLQTRIFVGLKMAPEIAGELALLAQCVAPSPCRLVPAADIHLTLVPPWSEASISDAVAKLSQALERFGCFSLSFERLCYGPAPRRPHMLWAECAPNAEIVVLRNALLSAFGQESDRPFRPHVTLARIGINGRSAAEKKPVNQTLGLTQAVNSVDLFRSPMPGESGYEVVSSLPLKHVVTTRG